MKEVKCFNHLNKFSFKDLETKTIELGGQQLGRGYIVGDAVYPSVTTVTGLLGKQAIMEWRKRVGEEEANRISNRAATRGTAIHKLCEDYINNEKLGEMSIGNRLTFDSMKPLLHRIDNVEAQEIPLFSNKLRMAGRVDCIAEFDGKLSVIDFKTSTKIKKEEYIRNYFIQETCYCVMFHELTGQTIDQIVTIIAVDHEEPQLFIKNPFDYYEELLSLRKRFFVEMGM